MCLCANLVSLIWHIINFNGRSVNAFKGLQPRCLFTGADLFGGNTLALSVGNISNAATLTLAFPSQEGGQIFDVNVKLFAANSPNTFRAVLVADGDLFLKAVWHKL
eukprot:GDKK01040130.1.p2 GENE.GDKK01040130.1~~GDKK01040130.1.p2  ORF type:complete len:106 (-),score=5.85 GDKK01040130.1:138-455(-)